MDLNWGEGAPRGGGRASKDLGSAGSAGAFFGEGKDVWVCVCIYAHVPSFRTLYGLRLVRVSNFRMLYGRATSFFCSQLLTQPLFKAPHSCKCVCVCVFVMAVAFQNLQESLSFLVCLQIVRMQVGNR